MLILELFSGTKSVSNIFVEGGWECISLDLKNADISVDILEWDYQIYPTGHFDFIWASPPCTEYSQAKTTGIRNIAKANEIVLKTIEIISYFKPPHWVLENPQTGLLKSQSFMFDLLFVDVDYCKYGFPYRKRTRLWNNFDNFAPRCLCCGDCGNFANGKHTKTAQRQHCKLDELYSIPHMLILEIHNHIYNNMPQDG